jgi:HSP20 family molecular chaperone IbpA
MVDHAKKPRGLKEMVEESRSWDAEDLLRNLDAELDRIERGIGHMVWGSDDKPVTRFLPPLPITPDFSVSDTGDELTLKVVLPNVPEEHMRVNVDKDSIEVFACSDDPICKPYYVRANSKASLDPESVSLRLSASTLHIKVAKAKKKRLEVKKPRRR